MYTGDLAANSAVKRRETWHKYIRDTSFRDTESRHWHHSGIWHGVRHCMDPNLLHQLTLNVVNSQNFLQQSTAGDRPAVHTTAMVCTLT